MSEYAQGGCGFPIPWWAESVEEEDFEEGQCDHCGGDGFDPFSDYVLPCPHCGDCERPTHMGEQL